MISSPTKRILTDEEHATRLGLEAERNDAVSWDLAASIRAASMRARKTVTEGYLSPPPSSPYSSPLKQGATAPTTAHYPVPANETTRQVFSPLSSGRYTPLSSPSKRKCSDTDPDEEDYQPTDTLFQPEDQRNMMVEMRSDEMEVERPVKPLRRSQRVRMETSPPPVGFLFPGRTDMNLSRQCDAVEARNLDHTQDAFLESASNIELE
ncbi:hypothetical protein BDN67DRAFT_1065034 [Paxillus ammoniavirescens]|nr:hypothetical protein BDN67DRAFT_1065034 [Paxillus ammoniavirescens]